MIGFLDFVDVNNNTDISQQILIGAESYSSMWWNTEHHGFSRG
jgi:hypothetical protein